MALPPGFLDEIRSRTSIADVVGRKVSWDTRKSTPGKGDFWAPCPFHQEKTASFHVDDRQGYYYCFGCHAKGDAITFLREAENFSFLEAVEELAGLAGMEMPAQDPRAAATARARATLADVMEAAVRHYRMQFASAAAAAARSYLGGRGLTSEMCERFEIGFAPPGWEGLRTALTAKGIEIDQLLGCGLVRPSDKGRAPYDTFRNRIMFPIRDARGRAIAFGGRAMDPEDGAKYLNSPDTDLFDKGRTLYHHGPARAAAAKGAPLIVAEGYMDVIALARGGFDAAVAPLGTAITEEQLTLLWRMHDEPLVALDGDKAGLRAGERLIDLALPRLEAGKSLRFVILPAGKDPDDVIRDGGPEAMETALQGARPMVDLLWERETRDKVFDSPERRAALDRALRETVAKIQDPSIRSHYGHALREKREALFGLNRPRPFGAPPARGRGWPSAWAPPAAPTEAARAAARQAADTAPEHLREAVILASLIAVPRLIEDFAPMLEETEFAGPGHAEIAAALLGCDVLATPEAVRADLTARLGGPALDMLSKPRHVHLLPAVRRPDDVDAARLCVATELARLEAARGAAREVVEAMEALSTPDGAPSDAAAPYGDYGAPEGASYAAAAEPSAAFEGAPGEATASGAAWQDAWQDADRDIDDDPDALDAPDGAPPQADALTWRLAEAVRARRDAEQAQEGDRAEFDIAENGARIDRDERAAFSALLRSVGHRTGSSDPDRES